MPLKYHQIGFCGYITQQTILHQKIKKVNIFGKNHIKKTKQAQMILTNPTKLQKKAKILKSMKLGNPSILLFIIIFFSFKTMVIAQDDIKLQNLEPTFEEDPEVLEKDLEQEITKIRSKEKEKIRGNNKIVKLRALDKITAKTSDLEIAIGKKKTFGYLEILPKNCKNSLEKNNPGVVVYLQVKDLSDKRDEKIFVFNGWTFSSSPTLRPFDHPVYDLWVTGCENI